MLSNSQSVPPQTSPFHYDQQPSSQNFAVAQLAQCFNNGVLKDRNSQQQQQQQQTLDKRTKSFKDQTAMKLSTLSETHSLPMSDANEQITPTSTPTQKRKENKRKSNLFTVNLR